MEIFTIWLISVENQPPCALLLFPMLDSGLMCLSFNFQWLSFHGRRSRFADGWLVHQQQGYPVFSQPSKLHKGWCFGWLGIQVGQQNPLWSQGWCHLQVQLIPSWDNQMASLLQQEMWWLGFWRQRPACAPATLKQQICRNLCRMECWGASPSAGCSCFVQGAQRVDSLCACQRWPGTSGSKTS